MALADPLWDWVRPGDTDDVDQDRLNILVSLGPEPPSEDEDDGENDGESSGPEVNMTLVKECHTLIVEMWLQYSKGNIDQYTYPTYQYIFPTHMLNR